jgi:hypothetical protein
MALAALNEFSGYDRKPVKTGCDRSTVALVVKKSSKLELLTNLSSSWLPRKICF